jgi:hypothetical protein
MKKWIFIGGGAVVVIIIVVVVVGLSNLGPIIKHAVNAYGPQMTKTEVRLEDVDVTIFSGKAKLKDFYLGNPKGFKSPQAMRVGSVMVDVDEKSVTGDTIIIDRIEVVAPEITYEKIRGTDNFQTILNNVKGSADQGEPSKKTTEKQGEGKKLLVKNFIVRQGKVNLAVSMGGEKTISASLPDIHLKDVGKQKGGTSPAEVFEILFAALHEQITSPALTDMLNKELKALGTSLDAVAEEAKKQLKSLETNDKKNMETITDKVKELLGK